HHRAIAAHRQGAGPARSSVAIPSLDIDSGCDPAGQERYGAAIVRQSAGGHHPYLQHARLDAAIDHGRGIEGNSQGVSGQAARIVTYACSKPTKKHKSAAYS